MHPETFSPTISVAVPIYNDGALLEDAVKRITEELKQSFAKFEIIIVESGSTDNTGEIAYKIAAANPDFIKVIHEGARNGFGSAVRVGIKAAKYEWFWAVTADTPFPLDTIKLAKKKMAGCDFISSYRSEDKRTSYRRIQSWFFNTLVKLILGLRCKSTNSAFKVYKTAFAKSFPFRSNGWLIDAEIHFYMRKVRARVVDLPVPLIDRTVGKSSIKLSTGFAVFGELLALGWWMRTQSASLLVARAESK